MAQISFKGKNTCRSYRPVLNLDDNFNYTPEQFFPQKRFECQKNEEVLQKSRLIPCYNKAQRLEKLSVKVLLLSHSMFLTSDKLEN